MLSFHPGPSQAKVGWDPRASVVGSFWRTQQSSAGRTRRQRYLSCPWCWRGPETAGRDSARLPPPRRSLSACRHPRRSPHLSPGYCPPAARIHNHRCWSFSGSSRGDSWASPENRGKISTWETKGEVEGGKG